MTRQQGLDKKDLPGRRPTALVTHGTGNRREQWSKLLSVRLIIHEMGIIFWLNFDHVNFAFGTFIFTSNAYRMCKKY